MIWVVIFFYVKMKISEELNDFFKLTHSSVYKNIKIIWYKIGADDENRTHVISLEGWGSTIKLHLQIKEDYLFIQLTFKDF